MTAFFGRLWPILRRTVVRGGLTVLSVVVASFFLLRFAPGDAADVMAAQAGAATQESVAALREQFGLDQPVASQLLGFLLRVIRLDLGYSPRFGMEVADIIMQRLPYTISLMAVALLFAIIAGIIIGCIMSSFSGRMIDRLLSFLALFFYSVPSFWIGLMLIVIFSVHLGLLPTGGAQSLGMDSGVERLVDRMRYIILPATALSSFYIAVYARLVRAAMLDVRNQDFVRTAVAKGLSPIRVTLRHVLRNALLPVTTVAGVHIAGMMGGAVVVETVFSWPGLGRLAFEAVMARDFSTLMGILVLSSALVVVTNLFVDLLQTLLDPRIKAR